MCVRGWYGRNTASGRLVLNIAAEEGPLALQLPEFSDRHLSSTTRWMWYQPFLSSDVWCVVSGNWSCPCMKASQNQSHHLVTLCVSIAPQEQTLGGLLAHSEVMHREEAYKAGWRVVTHHPANMELSCAYNNSWLQKTQFSSRLIPSQGERGSADGSVLILYG